MPNTRGNSCILIISNSLTHLTTLSQIRVSVARGLFNIVSLVLCKRFIYCYILGFNAIKHIAQTTDDKLMIKLFQTSFDLTDVNRIQAFVNLLQMLDSIEAKA